MAGSTTRWYSTVWPLSPTFKRSTHTLKSVTERRRRTLVYAPAHRPGKVERAAGSDADAVILDLESTVDAADKDRARENLARLLSEHDFAGKETVVRVNGLGTRRWLRDMEAALDAGAETIRLPKIEEPAEIERAVDAARGLADPAPEFLIQLESPRGVLAGREIAATCAALPEVTGVGVGLGDYRKALGIDDHTRELRSFLLNQVAAVAATGGMDALAYVHKDLDTLREAATLAKELGHVGQPVSYTVDPDEFVPILHDVYE